MPLRVRSERRVAAIVALVSGGMTVACSMIEYIYPAALLSVIVVYFTTLFLMRRFVVFRIKPIYQILHQRDSSTHEIETQFRQRDLIVEVRSELETWAQSNQNEIARLRENEQYRKDFVGNVSHELKTPIFSIQGYILTLLEGGLDDRDINQKYLAKAEANIERLINIVNDLEDISRLENSTLTLQMERFDIIELCRELVESVEMQALGRDISLRVEAQAEQRMMVVADHSRISQVVVNLLTNSIKYGKPGGQTVISFIDVFDKIMIEVRDNGVGIERSDLARIFERFYRVDKSRSREQGGTGLGLAIVKHIIEAHRQTITVRSTPGTGTTFSFTLNKQ